MKLGIIIYSDDAETVWNAFRFANFTLAMGDEVRVFLIGKGVECAWWGSLDTKDFNVTQQIESFLDASSQIFACGTCLQLHQLKAPQLFTEATLKDIYEIVKESDRLVTF